MNPIRILPLLLLFLSTCSTPIKTLSEVELGTLIRVNSYKVPCTSIVFNQTCLLIQKGSDIGTENWGFLYNEIEGFDFEAGYIYDLRVLISEIENPPADGFSQKYTLLEIVNKVLVP